MSRRSGNYESSGSYYDRAEELGLYDDFEGSSTGRGRGGRKNTQKPKRTKPEKVQKKKNKKKKMPLTGEDKKKQRKKNVIVALLCFLLMFGSVFAMVAGFVENKLSQMNQVEVNDEDWGIDPQVAEDLKDYKNILLLGIDAREGENPESCRSDALVLMTINKVTNEITLTSIMRDSYLEVEESGYNVVDKITHAHAYGGPVNTVRALNKSLDLNIDDFVRVDWKAVADVTEAMGGIPVTVDEIEIDELNRCIQGTNSNLHMSYKQVEHIGNQTLNGVQIVSYCRIRNTDGDDARAGRIKEVLAACFEKALTLPLSQVNYVANLGLSEVTTSMSSSTIMSMVFNMTDYSMKGSIAFPYDWQGGMIGGIWYTVPVSLKSNVVQLHKDLFGQENYQPTASVLRLNEQVKYESGFMGGEEIDYNYLDTTHYAVKPDQSQPEDTPDDDYYYDDTPVDQITNDTEVNETEEYVPDPNEGGTE